MANNNLRKVRENKLLSKAELARRAGVSTLTIDRIEAGRPCRMDTKRKIMVALELPLDQYEAIFGPGGDETDVNLETPRGRGRRASR